MSFQNMFDQFKHLAKKHLGDPEDVENLPPEDSDAFSIPGKDKVKAVVDDFLATTPLIEKAGYKITDLQIELGIIPKIIPHFRKVADVTEDQKELILTELQEKRLMKLLVSALFKADAFQSNLNMSQYSFKGIEIEITALPAVRLNYHRLSEIKDESDANSLTITE